MTLETRPKRKKSAWKTVLTLLIILAILGGVAYWFINKRQAANALALSKLQTVPFQRETLISNIAGTGTARPKQSAILVWETSGTVDIVTVEVGDLVKTGQILMQIDQNDLPLDILQAKMDKLTAEEGLKDLKITTDLHRVKLEADITSGNKVLQDLQDQLSLWQDRQCLSWQIKGLQNDYDAALKDYQNAPTEARWAQLSKAKNALDFCLPATVDMKINELQAQITLQEQTLQQWQADYETIKQGPDPVAMEKLELALELANKRLRTQALTAPVSGTVVSLNFSNGDHVSPGLQALQIADLSELYVDVPISEVDIPQVAVGQQAELVFDAFFHETFNGEVTEVAKVGEVIAGVVNYTVTVRLSNGIDRIRPGMTAGVTIIIGEKSNVLVVPNAAITTRDGKEVVYVQRNGKPVAVPVEIGTYSNEKVEITKAEIREGEMIVINPPSNLLEMISSHDFRR